MRKRLLGLIATGALGIAAPLSITAAMPAANATSYFHIVNEGPGGCLKDQGLGNQYTVSSCDVSSRFSIIDTYTHDGVQYAIMQDVTGYCPTLSAGIIKAGNCISGTDTQEISNVSGTELWTWWDTENDGSVTNVFKKGGVSPYYLYDNTTTYQQWCLGDPGTTC